MNELPIPGFQKAIRATHGAGSRLVERVHVIEDFQGERVWEGEVLVFELEGHHSSSRVYAWEVNGEVTAVLHQGPVDGPQAAVRASIVAGGDVDEARKRRNVDAIRRLLRDEELQLVNDREDIELLGWIFALKVARLRPRLGVSFEFLEDEEPDRVLASIHRFEVVPRLRAGESIWLDRSGRPEPFPQR